MKPDVICIQETWLKPHLDFNIRGYKVIRQHSDNGRGGCATFIKEGISYGRIAMNHSNEFASGSKWDVQSNSKVIIVLEVTTMQL